VLLKTGLHYALTSSKEDD